MATKAQAIDKFELVTDKIVTLMERGTAPWQKPWHSTPYANLITGHHYRGINPMLCGLDLMLNEWEHPFFVGFHQAKDLGWKIEKGSKSTWIKWGGAGVKEVEKADGTTEKQFFSSFKWHNVFNVAWFDDSESDHKISDYISKLTVTGANTEPRLDLAEQFISAQKAKVAHGGDRAFYAPGVDRIQMPKFEDFTGAEAYYATHIHELSHWTGHGTRLNREMSGSFGSMSYAREELIAELSAAFCCNELGITSVIENHASYLDSWIGILKDDKKAFFQAASKAQRAAKFLMTNAGMIEQPEEAIAA